MSKTARIWFELSSWAIPAVVGLLTASAGSVIEITVDKFASMRHGLCQGRWSLSVSECCGHAVVKTFACRNNDIGTFYTWGQIIYNWDEFNTDTQLDTVQDALESDT